MPAHNTDETLQRPLVPKNRTFLSKLSKAGSMLFGEPWLQQYGAICYRQSDLTGHYEVMLITARGSGRWVLPKGGPMKGKSAHQVAEQEAFEEAGVKGKASKKPVGRYSYLKRLDDGRSAPCLVEVFTLHVASIAAAFKEHGQREIRWVSFAEAGRLVEEPELRGLFTKLEAKLHARPSPAEE